MRISEALARLQLAEVADEQHVQEAIRLFKVSTLAVRHLPSSHRFVGWIVWCGVVLIGVAWAAVQAANASFSGADAVTGSAQFMDKIMSAERLILRRVPIGTPPSLPCPARYAAHMCARGTGARVQRTKLIEELTPKDSAERGIDSLAINRALEIMVQRGAFQPYAQGKVLERLK